MLNIKNKISQFISPSHMQFDPVPIEDDELIQAIESELQEPDRNWILEERPDPERLINFWREAVNES